MKTPPLCDSGGRSIYIYICLLRFLLDSPMHVMLVAVTELVHTLVAVTGLLDNSKNIERKNLELSLSKLSI